MVCIGSVARGRKLFRGGFQGKFLHDNRPRCWTSPSVFLVYPVLFPKYGALEPLCYPTRCFALPIPSPIGPRAITLFCSLVWRGLHLFSAATQKRPVYILSLYPAVALLLGAWWQKLKDNRSVSSHILTRGAAYLSAASFLLLSGVLLFQILGAGLFTYIRPVLYPRDQAEFIVLSNLLLEHRPAVLFWATACVLGG